MGTNGGDTWHARDVAATFQMLGSRPSGLTTVEATERLTRLGQNELFVAPPTPAWRVLLRQFASPLILILLGAGAITAAMRKWADTGAILVVLVVNAAIGFWQEQRASAEVRALAVLSTPQCRLLRDGHVSVVSATVVVPGDVVIIESGDRVPADLRLTEVRSLQLDESMLTGEVYPVVKATSPVPSDAGVGDRTSMAFSGTFVTTGRGTGIVVATGDDTEVGRINALVQGASPMTPLQRLMKRFESRVGIAVAAVAALVFASGLILGGSLEDVFLSAVALAVASIPEALPVVLTIALSVGVARMARHKAVIRRLPVVEALGSTTVIGSDKTGTLTQNTLTVEEVWTTNGLTHLAPPATEQRAAHDDPLVLEVLRTGALTNEARRRHGTDGFIGDSVDVAMAVAALRHGDVAPEAGGPPLSHTSYEPQLGYSQTARRSPDGSCVLYVKGAPDALIAMSSRLRTCHGDIPLEPEAVHDANVEMGRRGLRVIATATRPLPRGWDARRPLPTPSDLTLLGLEGMDDPPRPGVAEAIASCQDAGIAVKMITGDHPATAEAIADRLGIPHRGPAVTGREMRHLDDALLAARLREAGVAARVSPQDKLRIVTALQDQGEVVAVTGDGVNDAPALKAASIGVAMGRSGTDVARESADMVLTDDNFVTIVSAVLQGRVTFAAIRKATFFLLSTALGVIIAVLTNVFTEHPLLFLPIQVLWINMVTNGLQDIALSFEPAEGDELTRPPRPQSQGLLSRTLWIRVAITGAWIGMVVLLVYTWAIESGYSETHARTLALTVLVTLNFFQTGNARAEHRSLFTLSPFSNPFLLAAATGSLILQWVAMTWSVSADLLQLTPLSLVEWGACFALGATVLALVEGEKLLRNRKPR
ncbi:cation-translocating P-type ATPase [Microbacterium cremeum]|uniref:cation-translocating P-type ATPase n=1 Tax=Microbacterium cremeum TaxID=2782169 RepID=UPI001E2FF986|nr:HAD-IC family P-type ATPase [Microbacterium cremeum]